MRICHVVPIYLPGILPGCSKYVHDISKGLAKKGHTPMVLTGSAITGRGWVDPLFGKFASKKEETINGVRVRRLKNRWEITATMFLLKELSGNVLPSSVGDIISLL